MKTLLGVLFATLIAAWFMLNQGSKPMFGWFQKQPVHLSPEVQGQVTYQGEPVAGLKIYRRLTYDKRVFDKAITDTAGKFHFPEANTRSRVPSQLREVYVTQLITTEYRNRTHVLWFASPSGIERNKTLAEKLRSLDCELTRSEKMHHFANRDTPSFTEDVSSICRWPD